LKSIIDAKKVLKQVEDGIGLYRRKGIPLPLFLFQTYTMLSTLGILLPIFALIFAGFACRKRGVLGPTAASELNRFVVWLALPALLFNTMAHATWKQLDQPEFILTFSIAGGVTFLLILGYRMFGGLHLADASIDAIAGAYPNTGYVGFPLLLMLFGPDSLTPTTIATILIACVLFAIAIVLIELSLQAERRPHKLASKVLGSLCKNPLIVSPIVGVAFSAAHVALPDSVVTFLKLLSGAASPCALVSLGLFLAEKRPGAATQRSALLLTGTKLVLQPALAWWLASRVFSMPPAMVSMTLLLAALPTGTGPFMLAEFYRREAQVTSRTILFTTLASLFTLSAILVFLHPAVQTLSK
jgi:malonate transporter and related proteins